MGTLARLKPPRLLRRLCDFLFNGQFVFFALRISQVASLALDCKLDMPIDCDVQGFIMAMLQLTRDHIDPR